MAGAESECRAGDGGGSRRDVRVALLRGINVGKAKRVAMADLRKLVADLGYGDVKTLLASGNVVFTAPGARPGGRSESGPAESASRIGRALEEATGISAHVVVLTAEEIDTIVDENPLLEIVDNPSRLLTSVTDDPVDLAELGPLLEEDWAPEALAVGSRAAYLWCPDGIHSSPLAKAVGKVLGDRVTARNWKTTRKLRALMAEL